MPATLCFFSRKAVRASSVPFALVALMGCQSPAPNSTPQGATLELLESSRLELPQGCLAAGSFIVNFTVTQSGRTADIHAPSGPACVQQALTAWIASFRYQPPSQATPTTMEWLMVTAKRGS